jgi:DNA-binding FadR family transcriptional regulator
MVQFGISRPILRETFRILETESLITVRRGSRGGATVTSPDLSVAARYVGLLLEVQGTTIGDVYEARSMLEPICARMLAERRTDQDLLQLRACVEEVRSVVEAGGERGGDPEQLSRLTYHFHELVLKGSGNRTLALQGAVLQDIAAKHLSVSLSRSIGEDPTMIEQFRRNIRSYRKLILLVEAKDAPEAEAHWRRHMDAAGKGLLRDLSDHEVVDLFA